ncbi:copper resistance CopC/CopD family protein [Streptomyces megasporus]|uniref:copper resistance CopC/CopD family protein n=1 Tax=Streptomyces megasporus TaxID=44060 RepID=UPI0004E12791|nr:copper resistance protein CopC [Streptomyces megasporus]
MTTAVPRTTPRSPSRAPRLVRTLLSAALLAVFAVLGLPGGATPAGAHAVLTGSTPAQGDVVPEAPREVTLVFTESVALSDDSIRVLAPDGERVDTGEPGERPAEDGGDGEGFRYGVELRDGLADGTYTVAWRAVSADSHPIAGGFTFSIGAPSETSVTVSGEEPGGGSAGALYDTARYVAYAGWVLLVGGAVFVLACRPGAARVRPVRRLVVTGWVSLTAATIATLLLRGPYTGSGGLGDVLDPGVIREVLETRQGTALVSRLLLLAAAALLVSILFGAYARQDAAVDATGNATGEDAGDAARERRDLAIGLAVGGAVVSIGLAATWAMAEHASTGIQTEVAIPLDIVHLLAVAVWLGGLAALLVDLWRGPAVPREAVARFSRLALCCVSALVVTGLYQSWRQVGDWSALVSTSYGRLLLLKVGLVVLLVGVARSSRRWTARLVDAAAANKETEREEEEEKQEKGEEARREPESAGHEQASEGTEATESAAVLTPERAAQLARQRDAMETARRRRERDADPVRSGLRRSVLVEAVIAIVVLAVTTLLTGTEPARTAVAADRSGTATTERPSVGAGPISLVTPFDTGGPEGKGSARLDIDPGRSGDNTLHLRLTDPEDRPMDAPEVKVSFTLEERDIGPLTAPLEKVAEGHWTAEGFQLPLSGTWRASVTVRTSDIDQVTERTTFLLP